jgi:hypothetical protein
MTGVAADAPSVGFAATSPVSRGRIGGGEVARRPSLRRDGGGVGRDPLLNRRDPYSPLAQAMPRWTRSWNTGSSHEPFSTTG